MDRLFVSLGVWGSRTALPPPPCPPLKTSCQIFFRAFGKSNIFSSALGANQTKTCLRRLYKLSTIGGGGGWTPHPPALKRSPRPTTDAAARDVVRLRLTHPSALQRAIRGLVVAGADINAAPRFGDTSLIAATIRHNEQLVDVLLKLGVPPRCVALMRSSPTKSEAHLKERDTNESEKRLHRPGISNVVFAGELRASCDAVLTAGVKKCPAS